MSKLVITIHNMDDKNEIKGINGVETDKLPNDYRDMIIDRFIAVYKTIETHFPGHELPNVFQYEYTPICELKNRKFYNKLKVLLAELGYKSPQASLVTAITRNLTIDGIDYSVIFSLYLYHMNRKALKKIIHVNSLDDWFKIISKNKTYIR